MSSRFIMPFADVGSGIKPSSGAQLFFFEVDGVTPKNTFSDQLSSPTPNANPVESDSNGVFGDIYIDGSYKVTLKDKDSIQIFGGARVDSASGESTSSLTTLGLTNSTTEYGSDVAISTSGFTTSGDGGSGSWIQNGVTGQTPNQNPAQLGNALLNDANGNQWSLITNGTIDPLPLGAIISKTIDSSSAMQAAVNAMLSLNTGALKLPDGDVLINSAIGGAVGNLKRYTVYGTPSSRLVVGGASGGLIFTSGFRTSPMNFLSMSIVSVIQNAGTAIQYICPEGGNQADRIFTAQDIFIGAETFAGTDQGFNKGVVAEGLFRPYIRNILVTGGSASTHKMEVGISVDGTFKSQILDSYVLGSADFGISDVGLNGEGGYIDSNTVNGADVGYNRIRSANEPELWFINNHFNCKTVGVNIDGAKYINLVNNLMYVTDNSAATYYDFKLKNIEGGKISGNDYRQPFNPSRKHVFLDGSGTHMQDIETDDKGLYATAIEYIEITAGCDNLTVNLPQTISNSDFVAYSNPSLFSGSVSSYNDRIHINRGSSRVISTIVNGVITGYGDYIMVDTEGGASSDELHTMDTGTHGQRRILQSTNNARDITVKDNTGNLRLEGDFILSNTRDKIELIFNALSTRWEELSRSNND